jgi:hypothetical protein
MCIKDLFLKLSIELQVAIVTLHDAESVLRLRQPLASEETTRRIGKLEATSRNS